MANNRHIVLRHFVLINSLLVIGIVLSIFACNDGSQTDELVSTKSPNATFVGSKTCISCHSEEYDEWKGSHHDLSMAIASESTVLADFNDVKFEHKGVVSHFFRKNGDYYVNTLDDKGQAQDYKIEYTFGVYPLQQYVVKFPNGAYQCLITAWDAEKKKWYHLQPDVDLAHDEWLNWTGGSLRWNSMCADCHSTNLHKNLDVHDGSYQTTFSEINVACESCHGPASLHVDFYNKKASLESPPKLYMNSNMGSKVLVDKCARCHSRRSQITPAFDYTGGFDDHYELALPLPPNYEMDGQIKEEDYVYGSFIQSKMYHNGVSCKDCHNVHSVQLKQEGNQLCTSCHEESYDNPSHHFHNVSSEGAKCVSCHMPSKTYMGNDVRHDHSFRVPRPDQSILYGTPNACNSCHTDKSAEWASKAISENYGSIRPIHFSDSLLSGYSGNAGAFYHLINKKDYPDVIRATAMRQFAAGPLSPKERDAILKFLNDSSALVRKEAVMAVDQLGGSLTSKYVEELLMDSIRLIRIAAAQYASKHNNLLMNDSLLSKARGEYITKLNVNADFTGGQHQLAVYYEGIGNTSLAIKAYRKAISIDSYNNTSRMNLALLLYKNGDAKDAEKLYLEVVRLEPEFAYSYYMLGLLYHELGDDKKSLFYFSEACGRKPYNARAYYNYALKLQKLGDFKTSLSMLDKALTEDKNNEDLLYVKLIAQMNLNQQEAAQKTCLKLIELSPRNPDYRQIMNQLKYG